MSNALSPSSQFEPLVMCQPQSIATNEDCMDVMKRYTDKFFALAIVDPPYGVGNFQQSDGNYEPVTWNNSIPDEKYFDEVRRVSKERIVWGANYYNCFDGNNGAIIWDKMNRHPSMSRCEIASYSGQKKVDYFRYEWHGYVVKRIEVGAFHPCQKPIALYDWLLRNYAQKGDNILDTHLGSGSSRIACHKAGLDFVGMEIDKDYFEAQEKRFREYLLQLPMQFAAV